MSLETLIGDARAALVRLIQIGLGWRYPTRADLTALAAMDVLVLNDGALVYVTSEVRSTVACVLRLGGQLPTVIAPRPRRQSARPMAGGTRSSPTGRMARVARTSARRQSGYLKAVQKAPGLFGGRRTRRGDRSSLRKNPSVLVQFTGDSPVADSSGCAVRSTRTR